MDSPFLFPRRVDSAIAGLEEAKNLAGESPPPDSDPFRIQIRLATPSLERILPICQANSATPNRRFEFDERSQLFIGAHNETLSVAAMRVRNPDRSPVGIHG